MARNVMFFGDIADGFDRKVAEAERELEWFLREKNYSTGWIITASVTIAFIRFSQSFVDVLRLGNGFRDGGLKGIGTDSLRLLSAGGLAGSTVSRLSRILAVKQTPNTVVCVWVTSVNGLRRTGQRFFVTLEELATKSGVNLTWVNNARGTSADQIKNLQIALSRMGVPIRQIAKPSSAVLDGIAEMAKANRGGVVAFAIRYESLGKEISHQLFASYGASAGLTITDTTGKIYRSIDALARHYRGADLSVPAECFFFIKNAAIINAAEGVAAAGGLANIVLELLPVVTPSTQPERNWGRVGHNF